LQQGNRKDRFADKAVQYLLSLSPSAATSIPAFYSLILQTRPSRSPRKSDGPIERFPVSAKGGGAIHKVSIEHTVRPLEFVHFTFALTASTVPR
jgi:hypothetical protein